MSLPFEDTDRPLSARLSLTTVSVFDSCDIAGKTMKILVFLKIILFFNIVLIDSVLGFKAAETLFTWV